VHFDVDVRALRSVPWLGGVLRGRLAALGVAAVLAACGDTAARPLYSAPSPIQIDGGSTDAGAKDAGSTDASDGGTRPCQTDQPLVLVTTTPSNVSRPGAVYSDPPIEQYTPRPIGVRLTTAAGAPVRGCDVAWMPAAGSGWVFPVSQETDVDGRVDAWWTAGPNLSQTVRAAVTDGKGGGASVIIAGSTEATPTSAARVYVEYPADPFDGYSVEVVPQLAPVDARFGALWTLACGAGIDIASSSDGGPPASRAFAFCWDSNSVKTTILDVGVSSCHPISDPSGVRGTWCSQPYPWKVGDPYRFDLETQQVLTGYTDYAFYVTAVTTGERAKLVEFRFASADRPSAASSYLQPDAIGASCLEAARQSALFRNVKRIDANVASAIGTATFARDYDPSDNAICANYAYGTSEGAFFLSTGGDRVGPPYPPGWPAPVIALP
jgi:hypothetical protein